MTFSLGSVLTVDSPRIHDTPRFKVFSTDCQYQIEWRTEDGGSDNQP